MTEVETIQVAAAVLSTLVTPAIAYGAWLLRDIRGELRRVNGRLLRQEQWAMDHDHADDRTHQADQGRFERLEEHLYRDRGGVKP